MWVSVARGAGQGGAGGFLIDGGIFHFPSADSLQLLGEHFERDEILSVEAGSPHPGKHASICLSLELCVEGLGSLRQDQSATRPPECIHTKVHTYMPGIS